VSRPSTSPTGTPPSIRDTGRNNAGPASSWVGPSREHHPRHSDVGPALLRHRGARAVLVVLGGLLAAASIPPFGFWPLAPVGLALWFVASENQRGRGRLLLGWLFALGQLGPSLAWTTAFTKIGYAVLVPVEAIPGPSALTAALACAGLPVSRFCFEGFLPAKASERRAQLALLAAEPRTLVFFEAPHRIATMLADLAAALGAERQAVVARELTKAHETVYRGTLETLAARAVREENCQRGELTVLVEGTPARSAGADAALLRRAAQLLARELAPGRAAALAAQLTGASRSEAYALVLESLQKT
jgi:hypothetical protein